MMLRFQWDSLRRGDRLLAHDVERVDLGVRPAAAPLAARGHGDDVAVRDIDGADAGLVVRRGRFACHVDPSDDERGCWQRAHLDRAA